MGKEQDLTLAQTAIDKIGVFISNYEISLKFYRDVLGLKPVWESPEDGNAGFRVGYNLIILQLKKDIRLGGGIRLYFTVDNIEGLRLSLNSRGLELPKVRDLGFGTFLDFEDPDGNCLSLFQPSETYIPEMEEFLGRNLIKPD